MQDEQTTLNLENIDLTKFSKVSEPVTEQQLEEEQRRRQLALTVSEAVKTDPAKQAKLNDLSRQSGVPVRAIGDDLKPIEDKLRFDKIDVQSLIKMNPATADYLSDYERAAVAHNDIENLKGIETILTPNPERVPGSVFTNLGESLGLSAEGMMQGLKLRILDNESQQRQIINALRGDDEEVKKEPTRFQKLLGIPSQFEQEKQLNKTLSNTINRLQEIEKEQGALTPSNLNLLEKGARAGLESLVMNLPAFAAMAVTRGRSTLPAMGVMATQSYSASYGDARANGLTPEQADYKASIDAAIEVGTEILPFQTLSKILTGKSTGLKRDILNFAGRELVGEQIATLGQSLNDVIFGLDEELANAESAQDVLAIQLERQAVTAIATVVAGGSQSAIVAGVSRLQSVQSQQLKYQLMVMQEQKDIDGLNQFAVNSELRKIDPEAFRQFMDRVDGDQGRQIYIDSAQAKLYLTQTPGIDRSDPAVQLLQEKVDAAAELGIDVAIPIADFATVMAGTTHYDALRDSMTMNAETTAPLVQKKIDADKQAVEDYMSNARKIIAEAQESASMYSEAQDIYTNAFDQLVDTGRVSTAQAKLMAELIPAYFVRRAKEKGTSVQQAYEQSGLRIEGPMTGEASRLANEEAQLNQSQAQPDAQTFVENITQAFANNPNAASADIYTAEDYAEMDLYTVDNGRAGFAIRDGMLLSVFKDPASNIRAMDTLMPLAIQAGASKLEAFDGFLVEQYKRFGFEEVDRLAWDDQYAPEGWDFERLGRPDLVIMELRNETSNEAVQESERLRQSDGTVQQGAGARRGPLQALENAPSVEGINGPIEGLVNVAEQYARDNGIDLKRQAEYVDVDPEFATRVAQAYEDMENAPNDPAVREAYDNLIAQTKAQYDALVAAGYEFWFVDLSNDSNLDYISSPWNSMRDIAQNKRMGVFPTNEGFGSDVEFDATKNPLLADTGLEWPVGGPDGPMAPVYANDLFRAVHDAFGHGLEGAGFRARGEENAWQAHVRLFTGSAVGAITSETRGQNSWVNFGPNGEQNQTASAEDTVFADQKVGLMPEWTWTERRAPDMPEGDDMVFMQSTALRRKTETLKRFGLDPRKTHSTRSVAAALEARQRAKFGRIDDKDFSEEASKRIAKWMVQEVEFEMENSTESAVGWYSDKFQRAIDTFATQFPELATDKNARDTLTALIAITSDGQKVAPNFRQAIELYSSYRETGEFTVGRRTQRQSSVDGNLARLTELFNEMGVAETHAYLMETMTVGEMKALAREQGEEFKTAYKVDVVLPRAALILGPKLGAFYANLMGADGYLTMDRWWSRTFNRYRGNLLDNVNGTADRPTDAKGKKIGLARFKEMLGTPEMSDDEALSATVPIRKEFEGRNFKNATPIESAANSIYKAAFENLRDKPNNASDRSFMLDTVNRASKMLGRKGTPTSVADIQAILWYYEKRLYGDLGARATADISYEEAAATIVNELGGFTGPDIQNELEQIAQAGETDYNEPEKEIFRQAQRNSIGLYSAVEQAVLEMNTPGWSKKSKDQMATGKEIWQKLSKTAGVKAEELEWLGIEDYLLSAENKLTREQVAGFIANNGVVINEIVASNNVANSMRDTELMGVGTLRFVQAADREIWSAPLLYVDGAARQESDLIIAGNDERGYTVRIDEDDILDGENLTTFDEAKAFAQDWFEDTDYILIPQTVDNVAPPMPSDWVEGGYGDMWWLADPNGDIIIQIEETEDGMYRLFDRDGPLDEDESLVYDDLDTAKNVAEFWMEDNYEPLRESERIGAGADMDLAASLEVPLSVMPQWEEHVTPGAYDNYREIKLQLPDVPGNFVHPMHFSDSNLVSFLRVTDRQLPVQAAKRKSVIREVNFEVVIDDYDMPFPTLSIVDLDRNKVIYRDDMFGDKRGTKEETVARYEDIARRNLLQGWIAENGQSPGYYGQNGKLLRKETATSGELKDTYFIDEFQSDWHQQGRRLGYQDRDTDYKSRQRKLMETAQDNAVSRLDTVIEVLRSNPLTESNDTAAGFGYDFLVASSPSSDSTQGLSQAFLKNIVGDGAKILSGANSIRMFNSLTLILDSKFSTPELAEAVKLLKEERNAYNRAFDNIQEGPAAVPDAPFKGNAWLNMGLKRALVDAVDQGKTSFAWADALVLEDRWGSSQRKMFEMQYDTKMVSMVKKLTGQEPVHLNMDGNKKDPDSRGYWAIEITPELADRIRSDAFPLFQDEGVTRGFYSPSESLIRLTEASDLTTFIHEFAHFMYEMELTDTDRTPTSVNRISSIHNWFKRNVNDVVKEASEYEPNTTIIPRHVNQFLDNGTTGDEQRDRAIRRAVHEQFARGFEKYTMEGVAPSIELRNAFRSFARWMVEAYKSLRRFMSPDSMFNPENIKLDNEMRQVFDRLLATEEQIAAAQARAEYAPMFTDAAMAGMTEEQYAKYLTAQEKAKDKDTETLRDQLMKELRRQTQKWWNDELADETEAQLEILQTQRVYRAQEALKNGSVKMDHATVKDLVGEDVTNVRGIQSRRIPTKLNGMTAKGGKGVHPDEAAALLGYDSGAQMISEIIEAEAINDKAKTIAEDIMKERHGDAMSDGSIERLADEALLNEERGAVLIRELRALNKGTGAPKINRAQFKALAEDEIGKLAFRNIHPAKYRKAEIRAAQEAAVALATGNREAAAQAKLRQVMNFYLNKAATEARNDTLKVVDRMARYNKKNVREAIMKAENGYWEQIVKILQRFEFRKSASMKMVDNKNQGIMAWMNERIEQDGDALVLSPEILDEMFTTHWKNVPYNQLKGIDDSVKNIEHVARYANKIKTQGEEIEFKKLVQKWVDHIKGNDTSKGKFKTQRTSVIEGRSWGRMAMAQMTKIPFLAQWLDGGERGGLSFDLLSQPLTDAYSEEVKLWAEVGQPVMELIEGRSKATQKRHAQKLYIPEIADADNDGHLYGHQVIAVALNVGNEGNLRKLLLGEGWAQQDDDSSISIENPKLQAVLSRMTREDWDLVQAIWDQMDSLYPRLAEVHRRTTGLTPPKVQAVPIQTEFGEYAGGYYPMKYDSKRSIRAEQNEDKLNAQLDSMFSNASSIHASVTTGATNERTGFFAPVRLSLDVVPNHFQEAIHYITHHDAVRQINKLIQNPQVAQAIKDSLGPEEYAQLKPWLNDVAKDGFESGTKLWWEDVMARLRFGVTLGSMGFSASTGLLQFLGWFNIAGEVGPKYFYKATRQILGSETSIAEAWEFASANSKILNTRVTSMDREIKNAMNRINSKVSVATGKPVKDAFMRFDNSNMLNAIQEASMKHIGYIQTYMVDLPTWYAAYIKELELSGDEAKAYRVADLTVENVQGSGITKDLPSILRTRNEANRMFTMFMTFFSSLWNIERDLVKGTKTGLYSPTTTAAKLMFFFTIPVAMEMLARGELGGEDEEPEEQLQAYLTKLALYPAASVPFARDVISGTIGEFGYTMTPLAGVIERGTKSVPELLTRPLTDEDITRGQLKGAVTFAGTALNIPGVGQAFKTGEHLYEVLEEGEDLTARELLLGPDREEK